MLFVIEVLLERDYSVRLSFLAVDAAAKDFILFLSSAFVAEGVIDDFLFMFKLLRILSSSSQQQHPTYIILLLLQSPHLVIHNPLLRNLLTNLLIQILTQTLLPRNSLIFNELTCEPIFPRKFVVEKEQQPDKYA